MFKIAWVVKDLNINGANRVILETSYRLNNLGNRSIIFVEAEYFKDWIRESQFIQNIKSLNNFAPDIVISTYFTTLGYLDTIKSRWGIQYIQANYDKDGKTSDQRLTLINEAFYHSESDKIVVSYYLKNYLAKKGIHSSVIQPGICHETFYPIPRDDFEFRVLIEGTLKKEKLVTPAYELVPRDVAIWGLGIEDHQNRADKMWVAPPQDMLRYIYSNCDILLKLVRKEGHPLSILEAMACGCIPICSSDGGHLDYCVDGFNCLIADDEAAAAELIANLNNNPAYRKFLSYNAVRTSRAFNWQRTAMKFHNLFGKILLNK